MTAAADAEAEGFESARFGVDADGPAVAHIAQQAIAESTAKRGGPVFVSFELGSMTGPERFERGIHSDDWFSVSGLFGGVMFGFGTIEIAALATGERIGRLHDFVVESDARGVGIGEAMMDLVVSELRRRGCRGVDAWALPGDRETKNFFETFGLKARLLVAHRQFDD